MSGRGPGATPSACRLSRPSPVLPWQRRWSSPRSPPQAASCATSWTARTSTRCSSSAPATLRQKRNGEPFLKLQLGDLSGLGRGRDLGRRRRRRRRSAPAARWCAWPGASPSTSATARASRCARCAPPPRASTTSPTSPRRRRSRTRRWRRTSQALIEHRPAARTCASCSTGCSIPRPRSAALARGAGRQVLPPGLPPRAARALPLGGPGRERAGRHLPGASTATWRSPARSCTTSARSRPTPGPNGAIELTDAGKLLGEIPLGYYRVRARDRAHRGLPAADARRPCCTSSSATTASSSTAARSCPARARPRSCTSSTTSAATSAASTGSRRAWPTGHAGRTSTAGISQLGLLRAARAPSARAAAWPRSRLESRASEAARPQIAG